MVPTCSSASGVPTGDMPNIKDMPAFDMSSYTVYEWMESRDGLGLTKPADAKLYAMIYQASMHFRGFFQINQALFAEAMGVSRQTLNGMLARFCDEGLIQAVKTPHRSNPCGGALKSPTAYYVTQEPINRAILAITERKRHQAIESWAKNAPGTPIPDWLLPQSYPHVQNVGGVENTRRETLGGVINNPQLAPMSPNLTLGATCGNADVNNQSPTGVSVPSSTCGDGEKAQVESNVAEFDIGATCGNAANPQLAPMSPNLTLGVAEFDIGATCGNAESDMCLPKPSTCDDDDKAAGRDFDQRYIEERCRKKDEVVGKEKSYNYVSPSDTSLTVGGLAPAGMPRRAALSPQAHLDLSRFLAHWPKSHGTDEAFEETALAWGLMTDEGFTPEEILEAGMAYVDDFLSRNKKPELRYLMFPLSFLTRPDGLRLWARKVKSRAAEPDAGAGADSAPRGPVTEDGKPKVQRFGGVWVYRDRYGTLCPLGANSGSLSEAEAQKLANRMNDFAVEKSAS